MRIIDLATIRPVPFEVGKKRFNSDRIQLDPKLPELAMVRGQDEVLVLDGTRVAARVPMTAVVSYEVDPKHRKREAEDLLHALSEDDPLVAKLQEELTCPEAPAAQGERLGTEPMRPANEAQKAGFPSVAEPSLADPKALAAPAPKASRTRKPAAEKPAEPDDEKDED